MLFLTLIGAITVQAQSCTQQWQCSSGSDYNYVACSNGTCACLTNQGFIGTPLVNGGCYCASPNTITWSNNPSTPYCVNLAYATQLQVTQSTGDICVAAVVKLYQNLLYPTPLLILNGTLSTADILDPNAVGRVDPLGTFVGEQLRDYYYAFAVGNNVGFISVNFTSLAWNATDSTVAVRVELTNTHFGSTKPGSTYTESGIYRFGPDNTIIRADVIIHNLGALVNANLLYSGYDGLTCSAYFQYCNTSTDPQGWYFNQSNCLAFLSGGSYVAGNGTVVPAAQNTIRSLNYNGFGQVSYDQPAGNNHVCRSLHVVLAEFAPVTHCPHVGSTGGNACIDPPYYTSYYSASQQF